MKRSHWKIAGLHEETIVIKILLFKRETKRQREEQRGIKMRREKRLKEKDIKRGQTIRLKQYSSYLGVNVALTSRAHLCRSERVVVT